MAEQTEKERRQQMFGVDDMDAFVKQAKESFTYTEDGGKDIIMNLLSDAQHELARGFDDRARRTINRAKYLLTEEGFI